MNAGSISEMGAKLRGGSVSAVALAEEALARIATNQHLHAFVAVTAERALAEAAVADRELERGMDRGPLHGIPYAAKELFDVRGIATTGQSRLRMPAAAADALAIRQMRRAGAVLVGKTTTYELAIEPMPSLDGPFPPARNPHDLSRTTGGSSSGSAAAVAGGIVRLALGTDTGGSIRAPAAYCSVVGLKPTYGRISRSGVLPLSFSLDHVGPIAASVADAAVAVDAISGFDAADATSVQVDPPGCEAALGMDPRGMRLGYARAFHQASGAKDILDALDRSAQNFAGLDVEIEEIDLPDPALFDAAATVIIQAEAFAIHRHTLVHQRKGFGRRAYQHLAAGAVLSAADLLQAQRVRAGLMQEVQAVLGRVDAILTASVLGTAPRLDGTSPPNQMRVFPFNLTGHPALALPIGRAADQMPIGLQLVGRPFDEAGLCRLGDAFERFIPHPELSTANDLNTR